MMTALFIFISVIFVGVGLPDSILGTAWPAMYTEFSLPVSYAGFITVIVCIGTTLSSLFSARLIKRLGTGLLTAVSTAATAFALLGFALSNEPIFFFLLAFPLGLGAGAIDTALNAFVALHYSASKMSFMHCFYGLGVTLSPFIMSLALGSEGDWRRGYFTVAAIQFFITLCAFGALPFWRRVKQRDEEGEAIEQRTLSLIELIKMPGVRYSCMAFFFSCAVELTVGGWCSSYFVNTKGLAPDRSAALTMVFYIGLSVGRVLSGVFSARLGRRRLLRISLAVLGVAILIFALPIPLPFGVSALFFIGLAIGPIYPNLVHLTPKNFGQDIAQSVMGLQQAVTYVGIMLMPPLFGIIAQYISISLLPPYLLVLFALYALYFILLMRRVKRDKKEKTQ